MACKLASIDRGSLVSESDPAVARMQAHLTALDSKYPEDQQQIGDMTVKLQEILAQQGQSESLDALMSGFERIPQATAGAPKYSEVEASYATLRKRGFSPDSALNGLSAIMDGLSRVPE